KFKIHDSILVTLPPSTQKSLQNFTPLRNFKGKSFLLQAFGNWQHRFSQNISLNLGLHYQYFTFNNSYALEPRVGFKYRLSPTQSINIGYGLHSQLQPFQAYFRVDPHPLHGFVKTNSNLEFTK